ncbi:MAG TPA: TonB-dependent receptor [Vicinamibacterales bacterium]|nr:TonB-dependent receptor [Vicinamibacterales bacterium]
MASFVFSAAPAGAQVIYGSISGHITDGSGGSVPGVTVEVVQLETNFTRPATTDGEGLYRIPSLPPGHYMVRTQLPGFKKTESSVTVSVSTNLTLDLKLEVDGFNETVKVEAPAPRVSSMERVVDVERVHGLPINGRQLSDIAATTPGVGLGVNSDPSKSGQHTAQIGGGNGRNTNFVVDGGDNNDDTIGGQLQAFPLEAIEEFNLLTQRFDAEFGRGSAVMNVVTKSGTNDLRGSWFNLFRNDALNAQTFSEKLLGAPKQDYERYQYGGSIGGPIVRNQMHFFGAFERTQQDTKQVVDTGNTLPGDGIYDVPFREELFSGKVTSILSPSQYLAVRYGRNHNTQPSGVTRNTAYTAWARSENTFDSVNLNHNWMVGGNRMNELVVQFSHYLNDIPTNQPGPSITLASGAKAGSNANTPQSTEQTRYQFRNDFSWAMSRHQLRTGLNLVHTPTLYAANQGGVNGIYNMVGNDPNGGVASILLIGGSVSSNLPTTQYGLYVQDDWRVNDRLTLNAGVRWDYVAGMVLNQTSQNFANMQAAGLTGGFQGTFLEDFGKTPRGDYNNVQPRIGAVYDLFGNGRDLLRGGWGIYTDLAYTNQNLLVASLEGSGIVLQVTCTPTQPTSYCGPNGFVKTDGTLFTVNDPISSLGLQLLTPTTGEVVTPRLEQPYSYQTNVGWQHELSKAMSFSVDYVRMDGRDLNMRMRPNVDINPNPAVTTRYLGWVGVSPNNSTFKTALSDGRSRYDAVIFDVRRRMSAGIDLDASYTLARATSDVGTAYDELTQNLLQDVNNPFSAFQFGPSTRTDARHRVTASAIVQAPYGVRVATLFSYHSGLPVTTLEGMDLNFDGSNNDHTPVMYRYDGLNADGTARVVEAGTCETVNCSRRAPFSQVDLRVSRSFKLFGHSRIEALAEVFNLFNATNPFIPTSTNRLTSAGASLATFMQPTAYAGDAGQGDQRIAQLGFRITF